jgi:hypothetical protein
MHPHDAPFPVAAYAARPRLCIGEQWHFAVPRIIHGVRRDNMPEREKIVAVGLFTQLEFDRWGDKLRTVYEVSVPGPFDDLLRAIDEAEARASHERGESAGLLSDN